jgi:serine/threonine-protein kinase CTR1
MRSEGRVKLLNFAYLSLDKKKLLGCGSYSKVYRGKYRGTPVAIKLLFTVDLNPEIIRRCCTEAQLLSDVTHPNVVEIFGVSVLPPRSPIPLPTLSPHRSICIVLEICQYGSLSDVIRGSSGGGVSRRQLPLCHADRMFLALGCARGLQALHSHGPPLCHRDVKSFNFLGGFLTD